MLKHIPCLLSVISTGRKKANIFFCILTNPVIHGMVLHKLIPKIDIKLKSFMIKTSLTHINTNRFASNSSTNYYIQEDWD